MPLALQGCSAQVLCDGQELEQFDVRQDGERTISCWIPSQAGQEFTVRLTPTSEDDNMLLRLYMDGRLTNRIGRRAGLHGASIIDGFCEGPGLIRPFKFAPLVLTDNEAAASFRGVDENLGTIKLSVHRVLVLKVDDIGPVHERSKKAGAHAVSLGDAITRPTGEPTTLTPVGFEDEPFVNFIFRYRPLELLQANGLAPRPSPPPISRKRSSDAGERADDPTQSQYKRQCTTQSSDVKPEPESEPQDEDEEDDVAFLEEQLVMLQKRLAEKRGKKKKAKATVKREPSPIRVPVAQTNEVIDLT
ncbi:hypothetical protein C8T65DRAFT_632190 [Cerioporus squamosus]|nr:hypothetical protein C8T65DRAFT_632190 [Cerioporus squamosus]